MSTALEDEVQWSRSRGRGSEQKDSSAEEPSVHCCPLTTQEYCSTPSWGARKLLCEVVRAKGVCPPALSEAFLSIHLSVSSQQERDFKSYKTDIKT